MRGNLAAVHDDDLELYLDRLGVRSRFSRGDVHCFSCEGVLSLETLAALFPDSGVVKVACSKPQCLLALVRWRDEHRNG